jgi:hypothetical protein
LHTALWTWEIDQIFDPHFFNDNQRKNNDMLTLIQQVLIEQMLVEFITNYPNYLIAIIVIIALCGNLYCKGYVNPYQTTHEIRSYS